MNDEILGHLRQARAAITEEQDAGKGSRELSLIMTKCEEAILWRQHDLQLKTPIKNEAGPS